MNRLRSLVFVFMLTSFCFVLPVFDAAAQESSDVLSGLPGVQVSDVTQQPATDEPFSYVVVNPVPSESNGAWELSGPSGTWSGSGYRYFDDVLTGNYTITWLPVPGWLPPDPATQTLYVGFASGVSFNGFFEPNTNPVGNLVIDPDPDSIEPEWYLQGPDDFSYSGSGNLTLENIPVGSYTLTWGTLSGWWRPTPAVDGAIVVENGESTITGTYTMGSTGYILVDPAPNELMAPWVLTGPESTHIAGQGFQCFANLIAPGDYTIEWGDVDGYITPDPETAFLAAGEVVLFSSTYEPGGDCNNNGIVDSAEETTTRYFWIMGRSNGVGWSMGIQGPGGAGFNYEKSDCGPLPVGSSASEFVTYFIEHLSALCPTYDIGNYVNSTTFYVTIPGSQGFELGVGPFGSGVSCWLPPNRGCGFNPDMAEIDPVPLDCNENGINDQVEVAADPSLDFNGDGTLDSCQPGASGVPASVARQFILHDAHPNPFNPQTTIAFDLPVDAPANLRVYSVSGRLVRTLMSNEMASQGRNEIIWNGRDDSGLTVSSGVYFYQLDAGGFSGTKRMILIK